MVNKLFTLQLQHMLHCSTLRRRRPIGNSGIATLKLQTTSYFDKSEGRFRAASHHGPPNKRNSFHDDQIVPRASDGRAPGCRRHVALLASPAQAAAPKLTTAVNNALADAQKAANAERLHGRRRPPSPRPRRSPAAPTYDNYMINTLRHRCRTSTCNDMAGAAAAAEAAADSPGHAGRRQSRQSAAPR